MSASAPLLQADDLTLRFGGNVALDQVGFEVAERELFAIIGPNGAGKTSTFNCISGVYRPQTGSIRLRDPSIRAQARRSPRMQRCRQRSGTAQPMRRRSSTPG